MDGQSSYLLWMRVELALLIIATVTGVLSLGGFEAVQIQAAAAALVFTAGIAVTFYLKSQAFENKWYVGRALAESIKSLTWKYITKGEPFVDKLTDEEVDGIFVKTLKAMLDENRDYTSITYAGLGAETVVTDKMREFRNQDLENRRSSYVDLRVKDQQQWYKRKSLFNKRKASINFWIAIGAQITALVYSIYMIARPEAINITPVFATAATVVFTWLQIKRHQDLSQSYASAYNDINLILAEAEYATTEDKFEVFVADAETAFSREHTMWLARRDATTNQG